MEYILNQLAVVSLIPQHMREEWLKDRFGLITGTKYFGIICSKTNGQRELHAKKICGIIEDQIPAEHMSKVQFGLDNEYKVREELERQLEKKIYELGVIRENPTSIFACSIDGILEDGDIVELKTTEKPFPTEYKSDYSEIPFTYMWQMTHNCVCTGAKGCHYMSYHRNEDMFYYRYVPFNKKIWKEISEKAIAFYAKFIYPIYDITSRTVREVKLLPESTQIEEKKDTDRWLTATKNSGRKDNGGRGYYGNLLGKPAARYSQMGHL